MFMRAALREAAKGAGLTSPNPAVGAVLVHQGKIVARGHHCGRGTPHAEIACLEKFGRALPAAATLYVTLEPCSTVGRTPACTTALQRAGLRRLVVGAVDVNPAHAGRGLEILRRAGVEVVAGVLAEECAALNEAFNKWIVTRRPFVIAKCGLSLDGRLTRPPADPRWLTSAAARAQANAFRAQVDSILIGARTLRADNPRLTARGRPGARQPWRVVLTRSGNLPRASHLFTDQFASRTLVYHDQPLAAVLDSLGDREITSVLLEGGGDILSQALDERLLDRVHLYFAPVLVGGPVVAFAGRGAAATLDGVRLRDLHFAQIGDDIFLNARADYSATGNE